MRCVLPATVRSRVQTSGIIGSFGAPAAGASSGFMPFSTAPRSSTVSVGSR